MCIKLRLIFLGTQVRRPSNCISHVMQFLVKGCCLFTFSNHIIFCIITYLLIIGRAYERRVALEDLQRRGAILTTVESAVFMLMGTADSSQCPQFKAVSGLVKHFNASNSVWFE